MVWPAWCTWKQSLKGPVVTEIGCGIVIINDAVVARKIRYMGDNLLARHSMCIISGLNLQVIWTVFVVF